MAGSLHGGGEELEETHEINVTPFIDVMLVLLIIFMIAAPLATVDVAVDLPGSTAEPAPRPADPVYLTVRADLSLALGEEPVARPALGPALDALAGGDKETRVFLRADRTVDYGDLMDVMNRLRDSGYLKVALVGLEALPAPAADP
jgi:biopolymer transport protein ExbD